MLQVHIFYLTVVKVISEIIIPNIMNVLAADGATSLFLATASVDPFQWFDCVWSHFECATFSFTPTLNSALHITSFTTDF